MTTNCAAETWPKILIRHASGKRIGIISMQEAVERFGLDDRTINWFKQGGLAGTRPHKNGEGIDMLERYTADDALRDAAQDLLKALERVYRSHLRGGCYTKAVGAEESIDCSCLAWKCAREALKKAQG